MKRILTSITELGREVPEREVPQDVQPDSYPHQSQDGLPDSVGDRELLKRVNNHYLAIHRYSIEGYPLELVRHDGLQPVFEGGDVLHPVDIGAEGIKGREDSAEHDEREE